jgi:3-isopropylmalate/(R)-2-methylmalate dehydratase large subunit
MPETLFSKVWNAHTVRKLPSGQTQLFVGLHLVHEVTTPQAFDMLRQHGWKVAYPSRTFGTVDHIVPTSSRKRPFLDLMAEEMATALERNCRDAVTPVERCVNRNRTFSIWRLRYPAAAGREIESEWAVGQGR